MKALSLQPLFPIVLPAKAPDSNTSIRNAFHLTVLGFGFRVLGEEVTHQK